VLQYDFDESIGCWLTQTSQAYHRALNDELAPHGITFRQCQVLGWLAHAGELTQVELAAKLEIEPPTLAGILDRMDRAGWVCRCVCEDDRRKKIVTIGPRAEPVWEKIVQCALHVRSVASTGLTPEEVLELKRLLSVVHANVTAGREGGPCSVPSSASASASANSANPATPAAVSLTEEHR
jgi:MarR family transcriptional regulator for hemolysin